MFNWMSSKSKIDTSDGVRNQQRPIDRPPTPMPVRRNGPLLQHNDTEVEHTLKARHDSTETLTNGGFRMGPRPKIVHFDLVDYEEDDMTYEYYPPGVPVPPSRRQLFLSRSRKPRNLPTPPSYEVQMAMAQIRREIHSEENAPSRTWFGRAIEYYQEKRNCRRMYGKTGG